MEQNTVCPENIEEATARHLNALGITSNDSDEYYNLGIKLNEQGRVNEAIACYRKVVEINPLDTDAYYNMAVALNAQGITEEAIDCYKKVLDLDPNDAQAYNNIGLSLNFQNKTEEAIFCYQKAIEINPGYVQAYNNMGTVLQAQGKSDEAISCYLKAIAINPDDAEAYCNMGVAYKEQGKTEEAISCYQKVLKINPRHVQAYNNMGTALQAQGKSDEAISCYLKAIEISHHHSCAYFNMGNILKDQGKTEEAISSYHKTLEIDPSIAEAHGIIGALLNEQGKTEESFSHYQKAFQIRTDPGLEVRASLLLPVICKSGQSIERSRENLLNQLQLLTDKGIKLEDPLKQVGITAFLLAYHGLNNKELQEKIASFYINSCPELEWTSPHCDKKRLPDGKIKIGIISTFLYGHTIGQLFYGLIKNLSREVFHVTIFRFPGKEDPLSKAIDLSADKVVSLPYELAPARLKISKRSLDILFYPEIGMDPMTYFLAFSRLAPVQCTTWGHPDTTGIPAIDYFISSMTSEPSGADKHYSERLVLLERLGTYFYPPQKPQYPSRERFALPKNRTLYLCPQSLFKFHPDFDDALRIILQLDPNGLLVLLEGRDPHWSKLLRDRFSRTLPESIDQIHFLPRMSHDDFLSLFLIADAVLDTSIFSGGKTSLDCFALGVPIATLPGKYSRGRLTLAQYKQMGIMECVASDSQNFADIALRLANDKIWREEISHKIRTRANILYKDAGIMTELEFFFEQAVKNSRDA